MPCPLCRERHARRFCPALGRQICSVCCGTKRLVEIPCPADCGYLASARAHPPAAVRRQQERDLAVLLPTLQGLTADETRLAFLVHAFVRQYRSRNLDRLIDDDLAEAAGALAATAETAMRGVIYEHRPTSLAAQRLAADVKAFMIELASRGGLSGDRPAAAVLRRIERGARDARAAFNGAPAAYLDLIDRVARVIGRGDAENAVDEPPAPEPPRLIVP